MYSKKLHYFPIAALLVLNTTLAISYTIAVSLGHILPFSSLISEAGNFRPESCVFGLGLTVTSFLMMICNHIRYLQVGSVLDQKSQQRQPARLWNKIGLILGFISSLGVCVVGIFQATSQLLIHMIGAASAFGLGSVYIIVQGYLSKTMGTQFRSRKLAYLRIFIGFTCLVLMVGVVITAYLAVINFTGESIFKWKPHHGGYGYKVLLAILEWVLLALIEIFFLTLVHEFKTISFDSPKIRVPRASAENTKNENNSCVK